MIRYLWHYDRELSDERIRHQCVHVLAMPRQPIQLIPCKMTDCYRVICNRIQFSSRATGCLTKWILIATAIYSINNGKN